jgi:hypothetical protein
MYRVWYWAIVDRESDGRFIASIPDLGDLAADGKNEMTRWFTLPTLPANMCGPLWRAARRFPGRVTHLKCRGPLDPRR